MALGLKASELIIGKVTGPVWTGVYLPNTTNGAYTASDYVGRLMMLSGIARVDRGMVMIQDVAVNCKSTQTGALTLIIFSAEPTSTTIADNGALSIHANDIYKPCAAIPISQYRNMGTGVLYEAGNLAKFVTPDKGTDLWAALVAETGWTLTSVQDIQVTIKATQVS